MHQQIVVVLGGKGGKMILRCMGGKGSIMIPRCELGGLCTLAKEISVISLRFLWFWNLECVEGHGCRLFGVGRPTSWSL